VLNRVTEDRAARMAVEINRLLGASSTEDVRRRMFDLATRRGLAGQQYARETGFVVPGLLSHGLSVNAIGTPPDQRRR
jgi:hypothetical protein